ncbi:MAG: hypothetical protein ACK55I_43085, partial [bacterium]
RQAERLGRLTPLLRRRADGHERCRILEQRADVTPERIGLPGAHLRRDRRPHGEQPRVVPHHAGRQIDDQHAELRPLHGGLEQRERVPDLVPLADRLPEGGEPPFQFPRHGVERTLQKRPVGIG